MTLRSRFAVSATFAFIFVAPAAFADETPAPPTAVAPPAKPAKQAVDSRVDPQAIVCKRQDATGTRLGGTKVCHTRAQWAAEATEYREQTDRMQVGGRVY
jgi:hypothetical protein